MRLSVIRRDPECLRELLDRFLNISCASQGYTQVSPRIRVLGSYRHDLAVSINSLRKTSFIHRLASAHHNIGLAFFQFHQVIKQRIKDHWRVGALSNEVGLRL